jgi:hypothetical protein
MVVRFFLGLLLYDWYNDAPTRILRANLNKNIEISTPWMQLYCFD